MGAGRRTDADPSRPDASGRRVAAPRSEAAVADPGPHIPFNRPWTTGSEFEYIREAIENGHLSGNGPFTRQCETWLEARTDARRALLAHSCTGALEMAALILQVKAGDEIIMPSFTFSSTAAAFALRGATAVFVDIRPDTLNLDEQLVAEAITDRTRCVVAVHYGGVACEMDAILALAAERGIAVIEDAAQGLLATYRSRPLGSLGQMGTLSFHETKNVTCGEGGALLLNDASWIGAAEIVQEKGTNRKEFYRGQVDKYTWVELGSSYAPSEINAAFLHAQLREAESITAQRLSIWNAYHEAFEDLELWGGARRPRVPKHCEHNGHLYYLLVSDRERRDALIRHLAERNVNAVFHYVPLHDSPAGRRFGRAHGNLRETIDASARIVRLPIWAGMGPNEINRVISGVYEALR